MKSLLLLSGDGIGVEVVEQATKILHALILNGLECEIKEALVGGIAYDETKTPLPEETLALAKRSNAILFGAIGGPKWESLDYQLRPERALLGLRKELDLFANLRPAILYPELTNASSLKPELVENLDILIIRELTSGIYFGEPRGVITNQYGEKEGFNTYRYTESEVRRVAIVAFETAMCRQRKLCSVDKANVLEVTEMWRDIVSEEAKNFPDVALTHMYVDNASMQLVRQPKQFDVILTGNMFGDILSDTAAMLTGSIGMLPSASLNSKKQGLYEPVHGSAPDIAGMDKANPVATILSLAMLLRLSLDEPHYADNIESAVREVIASNQRTCDIASKNSKILGTNAMGDEICVALEKRLAKHLTK